MSKLHEIGLGQHTHLGPWEVLRVPGGWLFCGHLGAVFVPYSDEFNEAIS